MYNMTNQAKELLTWYVCNDIKETANHLHGVNVTTSVVEGELKRAIVTFPLCQVVVDTVADVSLPTVSIYKNKEKIKSFFISQDYGVWVMSTSDKVFNYLKENNLLR